MPKGVNHTHRGLLCSVLQHVTVWPCKFGAGKIPERRADVPHLGARLCDAGCRSTRRARSSWCRATTPTKSCKALSDHKITVFAGGPAPIYMGLLASPHVRERRSFALALLPVGRRAVPCGAASRVARENRPTDPRRLGHDGRRAVLPEPVRRRKRKLLSVGNPVPGTSCKSSTSRTATRVLPQGERGEVRVRGPQMMRGLPQSARGNGANAARRLGAYGRYRLRRRGRLRVSRRPQEGHGHRRRLQRVSARGRRGAVQASEDSRGGHRRQARSALGRGARRVRRAGCAARR